MKGCGRRNEFFEFFGMVSILGFGAVCVVSLMYAAIPLFPVWAGDFQTDTKVTVWAGSVFGFAYAAGHVLFGFLSDRVQRRTVMSIGFVCLALTSLGVGWSPDIGWLMGWRAAQGLAAASFPTAALAYIGDVLEPGRRPAALSVMSIGFLISGITGQLYAQITADWIGWRGSFGMLALVYLIMACFISRLPAGSRPQVHLPVLEGFNRGFQR